MAATTTAATLTQLERILPWVLLGLGVGFLLANLRLGLQLAHALRLKSQPLLTWPTPKPPFYALIVGMAVTLGLVLVTEVLVRFVGGVHRPTGTFFGEAMMFVYYGCLVPLSQLHIGRGF